ncbi:hypothetical protein HIM_07556 [Hirsutella minnesotensis 3608]|uniref:DUF4139 domain-containing protein n=1 Tax=Hirsutella minnesotensis 3608 TaxID=1043627 RepID=A0A0F8A454_9HYPO|nr:hypothetical protein HIM_07556 [Hirsutella minnesotensis 3608]
MDSINKVKYEIADLGTRSVVLFPSRAQISRGIHNVQLKPGTNEVTIAGLSPTVDQDSVKVEGSGLAATITDIIVEPLPNRQDFNLVYPDSEDDDSTDEDDSENDEELEKHEDVSNQLREAQDRLTDLKDSFDVARERLASAASCLGVLDSYAATICSPKLKIAVDKGLETYRQERAKAFADHIDAVKNQRQLGKEIENLKSEIDKLTKQERKHKAKETKQRQKERKEKQKAKDAKRRKDVERRKEKARVRQERLKFWPKYHYSVRITIECNAYTPSSSRRTSITSEIETAKEPAAEPAQDLPRCDLKLSYVTSEAGWTPCYDLDLSTTDATASLCFDAKVRNATSETWSGCKLALSTSQAIFGGLDDAAPVLVPWKIRLAAKGPESPMRDVARSLEECNFRGQLKQHHRAAAQVRREKMFVPATWEPGSSFEEGTDSRTGLFAPASQQRPQESGFGPCSSSQNRFGSGLAFGSSSGAATGGLFGGFGAARSSLGDQPNVSPPVALLGSATTGSHFGFGSGAKNEAEATPETPVAFARYASAPEGGLAMPADLKQNLDFEDSIVEDTGFTTSYEIPGLKSLAPSSTSPKQRVMRLRLSDVVFDRTVVAKYRPVANLKAEVKNTSKMAWNKGLVGVVLDGAFLGRMTLPSCSAGESFTLNLGIDPAIQVKYPQPQVRKDSAGFFSKEDTYVYTRSVTLHNTRTIAGRSATIRVLDQIPVSQDERLRVKIISPSGLTVGGPSVSDGAPGRDEKKDYDWGEASAALKEDGEVEWKVILNAGKATRFILEYAVTAPTGELPTQY